MTDFNASALCWTLAAVQILGLFSAWIARLSEGSRRQTPCQGMFLAFLALVAAATMVSVSMGLGSWLTCGTTFSLMVLTVTCDFNRTREAAAW
ncbi:MAG TPA: hypothetical protein VMY42_25980 [Thermoguttaceae bacterium]|nr:hypothetical protein [Thermoguttaceae bacterium]